jgi:hypothetical protein
MPAGGTELPHSLLCARQGVFVLEATELITDERPPGIITSLAACNDVREWVAPCAALSDILACGMLGLMEALCCWNYSEWKFTECHMEIFFQNLSFEFDCKIKQTWWNGKCDSRNTVELDLSGLIGTAKHPDMQIIRIIGFLFENRLHWQFEVEKNFYELLF